MFLQFRRLLLFRGFYGACGHVEDLRARRPIGDILTNLFPENGPIGKHDEYGGDGDVFALHGDAPLQCHAKVFVFEQGIRQFEGL